MIQFFPHAASSRSRITIEEFLESADARPIRLLAEYLEPARRFRLENIQDTVVFFGSARVHSRQDAERALKELQKKRGRNPPTTRCC